jgi:NADPH-dependent dioxygenase
MSDEILIVGAGPTGLIMACELLSMGVPCRIIDRLEQPVTTSRSFTIHARTLELLDKLDLASDYIAQGHKAYSMDYHFAGTDVVSSIDFRELDSHYPFCLIINQQDTEAVLRKKLAALGGVIEWNTKLEMLEQAEDGQVTVELLHVDSDETETIQPEWLIGCDGFFSTVRRNLNLPFDGEEYAGEMKMMDVALDDWPLSHESIYYFVTRDHMLLVTKLPGTNYRVLISDTGQGATTETARDDFQRVMDLHFNGAVRLHEPVWTTVFKISKRKTDTYRVNRIFLAGDAAHVNSPAGGQGMNVSMQDAFNLAWKLALVTKGLAPTELLDTYKDERLPIAKQMHEGTQFIHSIIMAHGKGMDERIALTQAPGWNRRAVNQIAGISYTYRQPEIDAPLASGDRAPNVFFNGNQSLYKHLDKSLPTLFVMLANEDDYKNVSADIAAIQETFPIKVQIVGAGDGLADRDGSIRDTYHVQQSTLFLIRPDRYIEYSGDSIDDVVAHLDKMLVRQ